MRIRVEKVRDGLHPSEVVVAVTTAEGREQLVVHKRSLDNGTLEIGYPIGEDKDLGQYLVELPRETASGSWRVWVPRANVEERVPGVAA